MSTYIFSFIFLSLFLSSCNKKESVLPSDSHKRKLETIAKVHGLPFIDTSNGGKKLLEVYINDQRYRDMNNLKYLYSNADKQRNLDSQNILIIGKYIDEHGIPGSRKIGIFGSSAIMLTLIHADDKWKMKYLNIVEHFYNEGTVQSAHYCMFIDRHLLDNNCLQKYGTQVLIKNGKTTLYPVDINKADSLRKVNHLFNISYYLKTNFNTIFNKEEYAKLLPELIKENKIKDCSDL